VTGDGDDCREVLLLLLIVVFLSRRRQVKMKASSCLFCVVDNQEPVQNTYVCLGSDSDDRDGDTRLNGAMPFPATRKTKNHYIGRNGKAIIVYGCTVKNGVDLAGFKKHPTG
jgi:hypothetical protein